MTRPAIALLLALLALPRIARAASPMQRAVESGNAAEVAALLDGGADPNGTVGLAGMTPLKLAVKAGRLEMARFLIERGADVNARRNGTGALTLASIAGNLPMVDFLLSKGAEATTRDILWARGPDKAAIAERLKDAAARQASAAKAVAEGLPRASTAAPVSDADAPSYKAGERPDDFALIVSVEKPMDGPEARYADRDAEAVHRHLLALGVPSRNILVLSGERAGRAGMEKYLERWLPNNVNENTRLFFYFAGNGSSDPKTGAAYLLPWDGDAGMLAATGYPLSRLYAMLGARKVRSALAVIDAGFSGAGPRTVPVPGRNAPSAKLDDGSSAVGDAVVLLAASAGEGAGTLDEQKHGLLTYLFLKGLNGDGAGPGGAVTIKRLFQDARPKAISAAAAQGRRQTPVLLTGTLGEGDLRLR
jgi:hypothetical protein